MSEVGYFAFSKAGHDKGRLYVIVGQEQDRVYLCDGRLKPLASPKVKKRRHIQLMAKTVEEDVLERLLGNETVRDEEIKLQIKRCLKADEGR